MSRFPGRRGGFAPVVLLGVATAGGCAVLARRTWVATSGGSLARYPGDPAATAGEASLVGALALVALAAWGVVLVTRGRVRRVCAGGVALCSLGVVAATVRATQTLPGDVADALVTAGAPDAAVSLRWLLVVPTLVLGVLLVVTAVLAVCWSPRWPEMGSRYDAPGSDVPGGPATAEGAPRPAENLEVWRALDEGRDPTA